MAPTCPHIEEEETRACPARTAVSLAAKTLTLDNFRRLLITLCRWLRYLLSGHGLLAYPKIAFHFPVQGGGTKKLGTPTSIPQSFDSR